MDQREYYEKIKLANSFDELFDIFRELVNANVKDISIYKNILSNRYLKKEEIIFFSEKIVEFFPDFKFEIYLWTGKIFELFYDCEGNELAFAFYLKSINADKSKPEPYECIANLFLISNNIPSFEATLNALKYGLKESYSKKKIYQAISKVYGKVGNKKLADKYFALSLKYKD